MPGNNKFAKHYRTVVSTAPLNMEGEANLFYSEGLMSHLTQYLLPYGRLWTVIMLGQSFLIVTKCWCIQYTSWANENILHDFFHPKGDLGRHGHTKAYENYSNQYAVLQKTERQVTCMSPDMYILLLKLYLAAHVINISECMIPFRI